MDGYFTVEDILIYEQVIDKSRFIALVIPVNDSLEIENKITWAKEIYPNARHYVYAYRLLEKNMEKASDDGEPQGTGGRPILDLLQHRKVWNVLIIVVRYFGGILLGTGGLTRAYGGTARLALDQKPPVLLTPHCRYSLEIPYHLYESCLYHFRQNVWETSIAEFTENVSLCIDIPSNETTSFEQGINEFTGRQVKWKKINDIMKKPLKNN